MKKPTLAEIATGIGLGAAALFGCKSMKNNYSGVEIPEKYRPIINDRNSDIYSEWNNEDGGFMLSKTDVNGDGKKDIILTILDRNLEVAGKRYYENKGNGKYILKQYPVLD